jgi:hypothetical protein
LTELGKGPPGPSQGISSRGSLQVPARRDIQVGNSLQAPESPREPTKIQVVETEKIPPLLRVMESISQLDSPVATLRLFRDEGALFTPPFHRRRMDAEEVCHFGRCEKKTGAVFVHFVLVDEREFLAIKFVFDYTNLIQEVNKIDQLVNGPGGEFRSQGVFWTIPSRAG